MAQTRTVTLTNIVQIPPSEEHPFGGEAVHQITDHVPDHDIPFYIHDAQRRWNKVEVSANYDEDDYDYTPPAHIDRTGNGRHKEPGEVF